MKNEIIAELEKFQEIASQRDVDIVKSKDIKISDYMRLNYILQKLDLYALQISLFQKHYNKFQRNLEVLAELSNKDQYVDTETLEQWESDFINNISDQNKRETIIKIFKD